MLQQCNLRAKQTVCRMRLRESKWRSGGARALSAALRYRAARAGLMACRSSSERGDARAAHATLTLTSTRHKPRPLDGGAKRKLKLLPSPAILVTENPASRASHPTGYGLIGN